MSETLLQHLDDVVDAAGHPEPQATGDDAAMDRVAARLTRRAMASVACGVVLLLGLCGAVAYFVGRNERTAGEIQRLYGVRAAAAHVVELALEAESGQRGYLVTHSTAYLEPFQRASESVQAILADLSDQVADDPAKLAIVRRMRGSVADKFAELRRTIDLERDGRHDEALAIVTSDVGRQRMEDIRQQGEELEASLTDLVAGAGAEQSRTRAYMLGTLGVSAAGIVGLSAIMIRDARRQLRRLNARRSRLRTLVQSLEERVARRTRELSEINQRFDTALEASDIVVFTQDRDLIYTWVSRSLPDFPIEAVLGRTDTQVIPARSLPPIERLKRGVIESGSAARGEISIDTGTSVRWWNLTVVPAFAADGTPAGIVCGAVDITARKETEARIRLLMGEVTHRSKNLLSVIQAIMRQTVAHSESTRDFAERFTARLNSLAGSHDLLVQEGWQGAAIEDLVRSQLGHYSDLVGSQIRIQGPPLMVPPLAAQHIGMALHELATNAAKYGALSTPDGSVHVTWRVAPDAAGVRMCDLSWTESGGPPVTRPARSGFGRVVIERTVARALDGKVVLDYAPEGLRWSLSFPVPT